MRFEPGQSVLHRLHPVVKLAWLLSVTVTVFLFSSAALPWVAVGGTVVLMLCAGISLRRLGGFRVWLFVALAIMVAQIAFVRDGEQVIGPVTTGGVFAGLRATGRLLAVILGSALFVSTTDPYALACGLMAVGLPYRWGFALITAMRLAPIFQLEANHVYRAQVVRGVAYDAAAPKKWWLMVRHLCLPMVVSALRTAQSLALSMEGRAFGMCRQRTHIRQVRATGLDWVAGILLAVSLVMALWFWLGPTGSVGVLPVMTSF